MTDDNTALEDELSDLKAAVLINLSSYTPSNPARNLAKFVMSTIVYFDLVFIAI